VTLPIRPPGPSVSSELGAGALAILPAVIAMIPFALLLGQQAAMKGLSALEVLAMSTIVFAGSAQFLAVTIWTDPAPVLALAFAAFILNLRHVMMGASLSRKIQSFGPIKFVAVYFMTDESWAITEKRALHHPLTPAYYFSASLTLFVSWQIFTVLGTMIGALIADPSRFGFDFAFPAIFIALTVGFWRGWRTAPVVAASAATALIVHMSVDGTWYVIAGAAAGIAAALVTNKLSPEARA
jgi:4-azaleucine resistance transporter AzlC